MSYEFGIGEYKTRDGSEAVVYGEIAIAVPIEFVPE